MTDYYVSYSGACSAEDVILLEDFCKQVNNDIEVQFWGTDADFYDVEIFVNTEIHRRSDEDTRRLLRSCVSLHEA